MRFRQQRGVAIITALLIVALAATISASIATNIQLEVRRTGNLINTDQALMYVRTAERLAMVVLTEDGNNSSIDSLDENWAMDIPPIPVDGGQVSGKITDLNACFNLNNVDATVSAAIPATGTAGGTGTPPSSNQMSIVRLQRLLSLPSIDIDPAAVNALIDWIDADATNTIPDGAENGYYMNLEQPYRTANQTLKSVSTLRLVKGFENADKLNALLPFVCAINAATTINVNTAPAEVLLSLDTAVTENDINAVLAARENTPFNSVGEFTAIGNLSSSVTSTSTISVSSQYFLLTTYIEISNARTTVYSIINRIAGNDASLVARMQNSL